MLRSIPTPLQVTEYRVANWTKAQGAPPSPEQRITWFREADKLSPDEREAVVPQDFKMTPTVQPTARDANFKPFAEFTAAELDAEYEKRSGSRAVDLMPMKRREVHDMIRRSDPPSVSPMYELHIGKLGRKLEDLAPEIRVGIARELQAVEQQKLQAAKRAGKGE